MDEKVLIDTIVGEVMKRLNADAPQAPAAVQPDTTSAPAMLAKYIDHTMLKAEAPDAAFDQLCDEAV